MPAGGRADFLGTYWRGAVVLMGRRRQGDAEQVGLTDIHTRKVDQPVPVVTGSLHTPRSCAGAVIGQQFNDNRLNHLTRIQANRYTWGPGLLRLYRYTECFICHEAGRLFEMAAGLSPELLVLFLNLDLAVHEIFGCQKPSKE